MKVLLIGELAKDIFIYGDVLRINPESPTPVLNKKRYTINNGMAGNVANHLKFLDVDFDLLHQNEEITKTRFVDEKSNYILLRLDNDPANITPLDFKDFLLKNTNVYDLIIVSDYCKGFLTYNCLYNIIDYAEESNIPIYIDTKKIVTEKFHYGWLKINDKEFDFNLKNSANINYNKTIITLGSKGAKFKEQIIKPENNVEVRDVVGAGDTFLTFFALNHFKTKDAISAIKMANYYAGIACSKRGVVSDFEIKFKQI